MYDNFNWRKRAYETSATHSFVQHDQVSAILVVLRVPRHLRTVPASDLASVERFAKTAGQRHRIPPEQALEEISPNKDDYRAFREAAILHVAHILASLGLQRFNALLVN